jgi:hypothetical protein
MDERARFPRTQRALPDGLASLAHEHASPIDKRESSDREHPFRIDWQRLPPRSVPKMGGMSCVILRRVGSRS